MNRSFAFAGAVALAAVQPAIALGAHPGGFAPVRLAMPPPHVAAHPIVQLRPFPDARHFRLQPPTVYGLRPLLSGYGLHQRLPGYGWHYWQQSRTSYLWYPALIEPTCYQNNSAWGTPNGDQASNETIGSLVDGKASMLSPQSFNRSLFADDAAATSPSPFRLQAGFSTSACGPSSYLTF